MMGWSIISEGMKVHGEIQTLCKTLQWGALGRILREIMAVIFQAVNS